MLYEKYEYTYILKYYREIYTFLGHTTSHTTHHTTPTFGAVLYESNPKKPRAAIFFLTFRRTESHSECVPAPAGRGEM